ncbi:hypothetical protein CK203_059293 [Vitis vinifera]|uniref:Uncharacterized protein n=1 Tax=Vitis vinifera TaxID=29760 RepID=A0A438FSQ8_VITVI|nr:hypothetical protein CK203_059293 [Vitis vinifera]
MTIEIIDVEDAGTWRGNIEKIIIDIMVNEVNKRKPDKIASGHTPNAKGFCSKGCPNYNLLGLIFNPSTATGALHYSSTQDPPNIDDEDVMDDNLEHGGVNVDVDIEILDDSLRPKIGKKESKLSQMGDALKTWAEASKVRTETSRARTEALLARVERYKSGTSSEAISVVVGEIHNAGMKKIFINMLDEREKGMADRL